MSTANPHPGEYWRYLVEDSGLSQAEVARRLGISAKHINQILRGHTLASVDLTVKFAALMEASPHGLWQLQCSYMLAEALAKEEA
jgi:HTH-type transcriptional regulator / antitoxin HigA